MATKTEFTMVYGEDMVKKNMKTNGKNMVYGRYNEPDNYGFHGVYKPTFTSLGGPHPVWNSPLLAMVYL